MEIVKLLERKGVIRFFGVCLILSPFFNTLLNMMTFAQIQNKWTWRVFWFVTTNRPLVDQLLYISTFVIGILMLRGAPWLWKCLLVLLGCYIVNQTLHFGPNFRANKMSAVFFLMNVGVFLFIADQLAWKLKQVIPKTDVPSPSNSPATTVEIPQKEIVKEVVLEKKVSVEELVQPYAKTTIKPEQKVSKKKYVIHFSDLGAWAELVEISNEGIRVQQIADAPMNIENKDIEMSLGSKANFKIRFAEKNGSIVHFKFRELSTADIRNLNQWLLEQAA